MPGGWEPDHDSKLDNKKNNRKPNLGNADKPRNIKFVNDNYLKQKGLNAHKLKGSYLGKRVKNSDYDLCVDKDTGRLWIFRKGGKGNGIVTDVYIK